MAQILIRGLDDEVVARLKRRARSEGRSLQAECRLILEHAARLDMDSAREWADAFRERFGDRVFPDSADLIREDRER